MKTGIPSFGGSMAISFTTTCATSRASKLWSRKLTEQKPSRRSERTKFLRRAEAAQRLQSRGGLHRSRLGAFSRNRAGFPGLRHSELVNSLVCLAHHHRSADCACSGLDV